MEEESFTATERLRAMLDERGVEWRRTPHYSSESMDNETVFCGIGIEWLASDHLNGRLGLRALKYEVTPERAVEATLGRGTCSIRGGECDQCGAHIHRDAVLFWVPAGGGMRTVESRDVSYCPNCGRRVEQ